MLPDSSWVREQYAETTLYPKLFPCEVFAIAMLMASVHWECVKRAWAH